MEDISILNPFECEFSDDLFQKLLTLWEDPEIQDAFAHKDEIPIPDHIDYFFSKLDDLASSTYIVTSDDILRARIRTTGIDSFSFSVDGALSTIYDVGGQRNERSKWVNVENFASGIMFCFALSDFNKPMFESSENRLDDSLTIFERITHKSKFQNYPFFLIGTKMDFFAEKIKTSDSFGKKFPEYKGNIHDPQECANFLIQKFIDVAKPESPNRPIKVYTVSVLNPDDVVRVTGEICQYISDHYYK